jgi:hypothetical protein
MMGFFRRPKLSWGCIDVDWIVFESLERRGMKG